MCFSFLLSIYLFISIIIHSTVNIANRQKNATEVKGKKRIEKKLRIRGQT